MSQIKQILAFLTLFILFVSCSSKNEVEVKPYSLNVNGDLEPYIKVVDGAYNVEKVDNDLILTVKFKIERKLDPGVEFTAINAEITDENGAPLGGVGKFFLEKGSIGQGDEVTKMEQALAKGSGEVFIQLEYSSFAAANEEEAFNKIKEKGKKFVVNSKSDRSETDVTTNESGIPGVFPEASLRLLTPSEIEKYTKRELKIMRNEIFARHGYIFKTEDMKTYFASQPWYKPIAHDVSDKLTEIEKKNIELIKAREPYAPEISDDADYSDMPSDDYNQTFASGDCEQFIKDYAEFADRYIKVLRKYKKNPQDLTILQEYSEMVQIAANMEAKAKNCNDPKYLSKITQIAQKIANEAVK